MKCARCFGRVPVHFFCNTLQGEIIMLKWALVFFVVSLVAGLFGFTGIAAGAAAVAKMLFYVAAVLFVLFLLLGLLAARAVK
jgi:uncharacterized membrane protein YtjA (UPF0391 family)